MPHPYAMGRTRATEGRNARFNWTDDERQRIAEKSLFTMAENPALTRVEALRIAVDTLPKERRKPIIDWAHSQWVVPYWKRIADEQDAKQKANELFMPMPSDVSVADSTPALPPAIENAESVAESKPVTETQPVAAAVATSTPPKKRGVAKGTSLTRWSDAERRTIAKAYVKAQQDFPDMSKTEALRKAMVDTLPNERHRKIFGFSMEAKWLIPLCDHAAHELELEKEARVSLRVEQNAQAEIARREKEARIAVEREADQLREMAVEEARDKAIVEYQANAPLDDLISIVARRLVGALITPLIEGISDAIREVSHTANPSTRRFDTAHVAPPSRAHKPRIYVVGLIREQHQNIAKAFPNALIDFGGNMDSGGISPEKAAHSDLVLLMTDYISHTVRAQLKRCAPNLVPLTGSYSTAKRCIMEWLGVEATKLAA